MTQTNLEEMIAQMEQAVEEGLAYLEDAAGGTSPQVDRWTAKEVLAHMGLLAPRLPAGHRIGVRRRIAVPGTQPHPM